MSTVALAKPYVTAALGGTVTLAARAGATFAAGPVVASLGMQGTTGIGVVDLSGSAVVASGGASITLTIPDGMANGPILITDSAGNTAAADLRIVSQYVRSDEYAGEGTDITGLAPGELDTILRRASTYAESFLGYPLRLMPVVAEQHEWSQPRNGVMKTRFYPMQFPVASFDLFRVRISNVQYANFPSTDIIINNEQRYIEILSYAIASYGLIGAISNLGVVANIIELSYTSGYPLSQYPDAVVQAVTMIATELIDYRSIHLQGLGGLSRIRQGQVQYDRRQEPFVVPQPAFELLRPWARIVIR